MSTGGSGANATTGQSAKPPLEKTPIGSKGTTPVGETKGVLKNPFGDASKSEAKQPPSKDNVGVKKEPPADANKAETKKPSAQVNKGETKNPLVKDNVASKKEPPAEGNKSETKQLSAPVNKGETKNPPVNDNVASKVIPAQAIKKEPLAEGNKGETKQPPSQVNKGEAKNPPTKDGVAIKKDPAADAPEGGTKEPAAEGEGPAQSAAGEGGRKPFSETTAAVAYYIDEFGNRKRYCGAARKRFKWLVSKGFTEEEARGLAHHGMQKLQPFTALKENFADDDVVYDSRIKRASKRAADDDDQPPTPPTPPPVPKKKKKKVLRKDRTFHEAPDVVKEALGGIRVGLIPAAYPDALLSSEQLKLLRFTVLEQLVPQKQSGFKPKFLGTSAKPGFIIFHCEDAVTVHWLKTNLDKLNAVVGADLRALEHYQIPRKLAIVGYFPNKRRESIGQIFDTIKEHNEGLNVDTWVLHKLITIKGVTQAIIAIDHQSAAKLIKDDFKINFKKRVLQLKPDVKFEKNVEVTVYIPKDPKQGTSRPWNKWWNPKLPRPPKFDSAQASGGPDAHAMGVSPEANAPSQRPVGPPHPMPEAASWNAEPKGPNQGPPHQTPMWGCGIPNPNIMFGDGPPNPNPMFGNGPPNQNPMFGNGPPNQNPMFENGPPYQNVMFGSGPPNQNPVFGSGPPNQNPMFGNGPPNQNSMFGIGPPNQNLVFGNGPPNQNPMFDNVPSKPFLAVCPPGPPQVPMPSQTDPYSYNIAPIPPPNQPQFDLQKVESGGQMKRGLPSSALERDPGFTRGNHPNFNPANQEVTQIAPQHRNPKYTSLSESERPVRDRRRDDCPTRPPVIEAERPRRDVSRDRVFTTESDRPWAARGHTSEESVSARRPRDNLQRGSSPDGDRPRWNAPRSRYSDRGSASEDDAPRFARSRDRYSIRASESGAERRPRSRSRHSPDRFETEVDRRQLTRFEDTYSGPDAGRPSRGRNLEYSDNRYVVEGDRRPRDTSRDSYSNSGFLPEAERSSQARPRDYIDRGPGMEADMHPRGRPDNYSARGPANQGPPRAVSPERFSNRATIDIGRPRDRPQEVYQSSEVEADRHPRGVSREMYPNRGQMFEDESLPCAASRERNLNRSETNAPEKILRGSSRDRFSHRGSMTEDDRWGMPRDRSLTRGSTSDASRQQWGASRDASPRGRSRERRPIPGPRTDVAPPWARQDKVISEPGRAEWSGSRDFPIRGAVTEGNRHPSPSGEESRIGNRPQWAESEDTFERRGRDTEPHRPQRGSSRDRFGPSRDFPNRVSAMEVDERPPWASSRGSFPDRDPPAPGRHPPPPRGTHINRDLPVEADRSHRGTSRDGYSKRDATVDELSRDRSRGRFPNPGGDRSQRGPTREGNSNRGAANEADRPPWVASRDDFPGRGDAAAGGRRPNTTPGDRYPDREGPWPSSREGPSRREVVVEAGGRARVPPGDGHSNRAVSAERRTTPPGDRFSRHAEPDRPPRETSLERYGARGPHPAAAGPPWAAVRNPQPEAREFREGFSGLDDASSRRPVGDWGGPRNSSGGSRSSFERGRAEGRGSHRDPPTGGPAREHQAWSGRPSQPGPHRGPVGGGRFY